MRGTLIPIHAADQDKCTPQAPDFFLEYRIEKVKEVMERKPELVSRIYDEVR